MFAWNNKLKHLGEALDLVEQGESLKEYYTERVFLKQFGLVKGKMVETKYGKVRRATLTDKGKRFKFIYLKMQKLLREK
jgi:hypothetical protein